MRKSLIIAILILSGCASGGGRQPAALQDMSAPAAEAYFRSATLEEIEKLGDNNLLAKLLGATSKLARPEDFTLGPKLSARVAMVDGQLRRIFPLKGIPEPRLILVIDREPNAFVLPIAVCVPGDYTINGGRDGFVAKGIEIGNFDSAVRSVQPSFETSCIDLRKHSVDLEQRLANLALPHVYQGEPCTVTTSNGGADFMCGKDQIPHKTKSLVWQLQSPFVFVHLGLLTAIKSWEEFDAMVAHELGHYYLLHGLNFEKYGYFYDRASQQDAYRPKTDARLEKAGEVLQKIGKVNRTTQFPEYYRTFNGAELLDRVSQKVEDLWRYRRKDAIDFSFDYEACKPLFERWPSGFYPQPNVEPKELNYYQGQLQSIQQCLSTIQFADGQIDSYFKKFFYSSDIYLFEYFDPDIRSDRASSLWEAFRIADEVLAKGLSRLKSKEEFRRIGFYTYEEEADAFAVNYLSARGLDSSKLGDLLVHLMEQLMTKLPPDSAKESQRCIDNHRRNWRALGRPIRPMMDNVHDVHHSFCYRLYNLKFIERNLVRTAVPANLEPVLNSGDYSEIRELFKP